MTSLLSAPSRPIKGIAFDAYGTLFDVYSITALAEQWFPGKGRALAALWREKQVSYTYLRTLSNHYCSFWSLTGDALDYAARRLGLDLTEEAKRQLMNQYACLPAFSEVPGALADLKSLGLPLAVLSNGNRNMLDIAIRYADLAQSLDHILSAETVGKFKTAPEVYRLAADTFATDPAEILFVSSNSWDVCGAAWCGLATFWVNRDAMPPEFLDAPPTPAGKTLHDVVDFVRGQFP